MLNHQRRLTLMRPTAAPTATQLRVVLTPRVLLLQPCRYEQGDDARMLNCLTSSSVVRSVAIDDGWSPRSMLRTIARRTPASRMLTTRGVSSFND